MNFADAKVIIFDVSGTIVNDLAPVYDAYHYTVQKLGGKPMTRAEFERNFTASLIELYRMVGINEDKEKITQIYQQRSLTPEFWSGVKAYEGVKEGLQKLRRKFRLAIATSWRMVEMNKLFEATGIDPLLFDEVVCHDHVTNLKPHPEPIELIVKKLGVPASECVMIGDTVSDVMCGKAAGSKTVAVTYGTNSAEDLKRAKPDAVVNSWQELEKLFL